MFLQQERRISMCLRLVSAILIISLASQAAGAVQTGAAGTQPAAHAQRSRYVVGFQADLKQQLQQQLHERGYHILSEGPGFFTVTHPTAPEAHAEGSSSSGSSVGHRRRLIEAAHQHHTEQLTQLPGVHSSEQDVRRFLHIRPSALHEHTPITTSSNGASRTLQSAEAASGTAAASSPSALSKLLGPWHMAQWRPGRAFEQWGAEIVDAVCAANDIPLQPESPSTEVVPWGIKEIGAWNPDLQKLPHKGRTIVCIIDSGLWAGHPEYSTQTGPRNSFTGCAAGGDCPFDWKSDIVGHGSHVAGTVSAPHNGLGVVGVISQGAEVHVVRVWNNTGDVSQGQGPYATDLVLAYSHCLEHLKAEQAKQQEKGGKKVNMVINMSFGSAGPLTVERMWIEQAAQRGDILFVGSAGNNGSWLDVGKRAAGPASLAGKEPVGQYLSYPASYKLNEMLSVANARCDGSIEFTSQKNKQVSISAPGMAILSSVPRWMGIVRGHIATSAQVTAGTKTKMAGWLPNGFLEPRPIQGGRIGATQSLPLISCPLKEEQPAPRLRLFNRRQEAVGTCPAAKGAICYVELPGRAHLFEETCAAMTMCIRSGGAGLAVWKPESNAEADALYSIPGTQLDCGPKCKCWADLKAALGCGDMHSCSFKVLPGVILSAKHVAALKAAGAGSGNAVKATVTAYEYNYKYFDGTSMAAPHVSGAAALLWRQFPDCQAADIAEAIKKSAQRLPGQLQVPDYAGGHGMLKVDKAYEWIQKHNPCAGGGAAT